MELSFEQRTMPLQTSILEDGIYYAELRSRKAEVQNLVIGLGSMGKETVDMLQSQVFSLLVNGDDREELEQKLRDFAAALSGADSAGNGKVRVILVSSLAEPVCGEKLIELAYFCRRELEEAHLTDYICEAYLYLPETRMGEPEFADDRQKRRKAVATTYATLKELDYYMNLGDTGDSYSVVENGQMTWNSHRNVFDACTFIPAGKPIDEQTRFLSVRSLAEHLTESFGENQKPEDAEEKSDYLGTSPAIIGTANSVYQILGHSSVKLPEEEIYTYYLHALFQKVHEEWKDNANLNYLMVERFLKAVGLDRADSLTKLVSEYKDEDGNGISLSPQLARADYPSKRNLQSRKDIALQWARQLAESTAMQLEQAMTRETLRDRMLTKLQTEIWKFYSQYGPYMTADLLTHQTDAFAKMAEEPEITANSADDFPGVLECLVYLREELRKKEEESVQHGQDPAAAIRLDTLRDKACGFFSGQLQMEDYIRECCKAANMEIIHAWLYRTLGESVDLIIDDLCKECDQVWTSYMELFEKVTGDLASDAEYLTDPETDEDDDVFVLLSLSDAYDTAGRLQQYLKENADIQAYQLKADLKELMQAKDWKETGLEDFERELSKLYQKQIDHLYGASEYFLDKCVLAAYTDEEPTAANIDYIWMTNAALRDQILAGEAREIAAHLNQTNTLGEDFEQVYQAQGLLCRRELLLPAKAPVLSAFLEQLLPSDKVVRREAKRSSAFVCSNLVKKLPLYAIKDMAEYDHTYAMHAEEMPEIQAWEEERGTLLLPNPYPLEFLAMQHKRYQESVDYLHLLQIKERADEAMQLGLIKKLSPDQAFFTLGKPEAEPDQAEVLLVKMREYIEDYSVQFIEEMPLQEMMREAGYGFTSYPLESKSGRWVSDDLTGPEDGIGVGDFYRMVQSSLGYQRRIEEALDAWDEVEELACQALEEVRAERRYHKMMELYAKALWLGSDRTLTDLGPVSDFDRTYMIYHRFVRFCRMSAAEEKELETELKEKSKEPGKGALDVFASVEDVLMAKEKLGPGADKDRINQLAKESELDYSFSYRSVSETAFDVLKLFYKQLYNQLSGERL